MEIFLVTRALIMNFDNADPIFSKNQNFNNESMRRHHKHVKVTIISLGDDMEDNSMSVQHKPEYRQDIMPADISFYYPLVNCFRTVNKGI